MIIVLLAAAVISGILRYKRLYYYPWVSYFKCHFRSGFKKAKAEEAINA